MELQTIIVVGIGVVLLFFGALVVFVRSTSGISPRPRPETPVSAALHPGESPAPERPLWRLRVEAGEAGREYALVAEEFQLGAGPENDLVLVGQGVAPLQARIRIAEGGYVIENLEPRSPLIVNGELVQCHTLADGDEIVIGETRIAVEVATRENA